MHVATEPVRVVRLPRGEAGTLQTCAHVRDEIVKGRGDQRIRQAAAEILEADNVRARDAWGEVDAMFRFVQRRLRFTSDPIDIEMITSARGLLDEHRDADCDEYVILLGSLLESIGKRVRLKLVRAGRSGPWRHIYLEVRIRDPQGGYVWIPADATRDRELGWEVEHGSSMTMPIDSGRAAGVAGWESLIPIAASVAGPMLGGLTGGSGDDEADSQKDAIKAAGKLIAQQAKAQRQQSFLDLVKARMASKTLAPAIVAATKGKNPSQALQDLLGFKSFASSVENPVRTPTEADPAAVAESAQQSGFDWKKWGLPIAIGAAILVVGAKR